MHFQSVCHWKWPQAKAVTNALLNITSYNKSRTLLAQLKWFSNSVWIVRIFLKLRTHNHDNKKINLKNSIIPNTYWRIVIILKGTLCFCFLRIVLERAFLLYYYVDILSSCKVSIKEIHCHKSCPFKRV